MSADVSNITLEDKSTNLLSLFASSSTLICCALPALFIVLGAGASFASLVSALPFLITLSHYKIYISLFAFGMILLAGYVNYRTYHMPCPVDPALGKMCMKTRKRARIIYYVSTSIFIFATIFTYLVPWML